MPISSNVLTPRQAELGKIKIGHRSAQKRQAKGDNKRTYHAPQKLETKEGPYFLITKTVRAPDGAENFVVDTALMKLLEQYVDKSDKQLRRIPIMLDSDDIDEVFPTALTWYKGTKLYCIGTGAGKDAAKRFDNDPQGKFGPPRPVNCPCDALGAGCKPAGTLWCTILAGPDTVVGMQHAFRTHAWNSIRAIQGGLLAIRKIVGSFRGVRLWLTVKHHMTKGRDGNTRKVPMVSIMIHADDIPNAQRNVIAATQRRMQVMQVTGAMPSERLGLPAPGEKETEREQEEIAAEWFHPGNTDTQPEPADDGEQEEEIDYDPETGVVRDNTPQSRRATEPALEQRTGVYQDKPAIAWAKDHPGRTRLGQVLRKLATIRGIDVPDDPRDAKDILKELVAEFTHRLFGVEVLFGNLQPMQAAQIDAAAIEEILEREAKDKQDAEAANATVDESEAQDEEVDDDVIP